MRQACEPKLKSPHGVRLLRQDVRAWNGVSVSVSEMSCSPGRAWHDISPSQTSMAIVLEQVGGRVEARTKIDQPIRSNWSGPQHIDFAPAGMQVWGYTEDVRSVQAATFAFRFASLESMLGESIDLRLADTPRLQFFDERIVRIGALLAAECIQPRDRCELYGDSLVVALVIEFLRLGKERVKPTKQGTLAPWQLQRAKDFMQSN